MDGPDAARLMRQVGFNGPIIGITGHEDSADYLAAGADIVLIKPIRAEDVLQASGPPPPPPRPQETRLLRGHSHHCPGSARRQ